MQCDSWNDESCDIGLDIQETDRGFQTSVNLPSAFFKHIIGRKAETKRRLENETKTQIKIPREGVEGDIGQCYIILITINFKVIYQRKKWIIGLQHACAICDIHFQDTKVQLSKCTETLFSSFYKTSFNLLEQDSDN